MEQMTTGLSFVPTHWYTLSSDTFDNVEIIPIIMAHGIRCTICPHKAYGYTGKSNIEAVLITDQEVPDHVMVLIKLTY